MGGGTPRENDKAATDGPHAALQEKRDWRIWGFLGEAYTLGVTEDPWGKTGDKAKSRHKWPSLPPPLCLFSTELLNKYFKNSLKGQQIKRLSPTVMLVPSSIYNATELKRIRRKQS